VKSRASRDSGRAPAPLAAEEQAQVRNLGRIILYFGNDWDAENRTSSHQMALHLARRERLVYVECPGLRHPSARSRDLRKIFSKLEKTLRGPRLADDSFPVYTLLQLPLHGISIVRRLNRKLVEWQVRRIQGDLGGEIPILWFVVPHLAYLPEVFPDCFSVYYCIDKYSALPGVPAAAVAEMDETITRVADVVFVASEKLLEDKRRYRQDVVLSPHGVDFDHFSRAAKGGTRPERPTDLPDWEGPIVGFFGLLESWIDLDLLAHLAESRPEWLLLLIGHEAVPLGSLKDLSNVLALGPKPFSELPSYACFFDVAILPYRLTEQVLHSNPIKLREYLAAGKSVVSVPFPHAERFRDVIYLADGYDRFVMQIERALREDTDEMREARMSSVASSTWEVRAAEALATVVGRMAEASTDSSP